MKTFSKGFLAVIVLFSVLGLSACKQDGEAEKAGKKVDQAVEQAGKKVDQTTDQAGKKMDQAGGYMDDAAITAKVKAEIASDPMLKMFQITVTTTKSVVRLSGVVDSQQSLDRALEITRKVNGVKMTENQLVVKSAN